jgi:hypothetical protein
VEGCGQSNTGIRQTYASLDKYGAALLNYQRSFNKNNLNPKPLSFNVNEDELNSSIEFSYIFDNDPSPETYFDYTVTVNSGDGINASIQGNVISRGGDSLSKLQKSLAYSSGIDLYNITKDFYNEFYPNYSNGPLDNRPISSGKSIDQVNGVISLNAEFNNFEQISGLQSFDYSLSFQPKLRKFDSQAKIDGQGIYSVVDLGYENRAVLTINGNATVDDGITQSSGLALVKNKINSLFSRYGRSNETSLDQNSINYSRKDKKTIEFNVEWSFNSPNKVIAGTSYDEISSLSV